MGSDSIVCCFIYSSPGQRMPPHRSERVDAAVQGAICMNSANRELHSSGLLGIQVEEEVGMKRRGSNRLRCLAKNFFTFLYELIQICLFWFVVVNVRLKDTSRTQVPHM